MMGLKWKGRMRELTEGSSAYIIKIQSFESVFMLSHVEWLKIAHMVHLLRHRQSFNPIPFTSHLLPSSTLTYNQSVRDVRFDASSFKLISLFASLYLA